MRPVQAIRVTLRVPPTVGPLLMRANEIVFGLEQNPMLFPDPTPPLPQVKDHIQALVTAQTNLQNRMGHMADREAARRTLATDVQGLHGYVQGVARAHPELAAMIAAAAGMRLRKPPTRHKSLLELRQLREGCARAIALAQKGARVYEWQISTNDKVTYTSLTSTTRARTDITGITPGTVIWVRFRVITSKGPTDWCDPVARMII